MGRSVYVPAIFMLASGFTNPASAQSADVEVFLSPASVVGDGASIGNPAVSHDLSDTASSLYVWVMLNNADLEGLAIDVSSTTPGVIEFTGGEVFAADILGTSDIRYDEFFVQGVSADQVTNLNAVVFFDGVGLDRTNTVPGQLDELYDNDADAFLFARIDYNIIGEGQTGLFLRTGNLEYVQAGGGDPSALSIAYGIGDAQTQSGAFSGEFGDVADATISVVPEPTSAVCFGLALCFLMKRRNS